MTDAGVEQMASAARLYYLDRLGQHEVAAIFGVSRSTVSRRLTAARERRIVRISIDPYEPRDGDLERRPRDRFGLRRAVVVKAGGRAAESVRRAIGYFAAPAMAEAARGTASVGVASGRTIGEAIGAMPPIARDGAREVAVVQSDGAHRPHGAAHRRARAGPQPGPAARRLLFDPARTRLRARSRDPGRASRPLFDVAGRECASDYRDRVVAVELGRLRGGPEVVAVTNGASCGAAILAAVRGGLVTSLVIDDDVASALLPRGAAVASADEPVPERKGGPIVGVGGARSVPPATLWARRRCHIER